MKTAHRRRLVPGRYRLLLLFLLYMPVLADDALVMPLAPQSLLLDVQYNGGRLVAVGERGHILLSDDLGEHWRQARSPTRQMLTAVHFPGPQRGWAVGHDGLILGSIDGGDSWVLQRDGLVDQRLYNERRRGDLESEQQRLRQILLGAAEASARSAVQARLDELELDLEDLEYDLAHPVFAPPLLDVYFSDELRGAAVGAFNTLLLTADGGISWTAAGERLENPEEMHLNAVTGDGRGTLWIGAEGGLMFRSVDAGEHWQALDSPYPASWFGLARAPHSGVLLAFGLRGNVFLSSDGGDSWGRVATDSHRSLSGGAFLGDDYAVLVGAVGAVLLSEDGGSSFTSRPLAQRVGLAAVASARDRLVLVGQGGVHHARGLGELQ
jgi:photosystem II stability/assembly factor-like uncharacterized protein